MKKQKMYQLTTCALMAALMCILGPMSIPIGPIPVSFTNFVIFLSVYLLGVKGVFIAGCGRTAGFFRLSGRVGKTGGAYGRVSGGIYSHGVDFRRGIGAIPCACGRYDSWHDGIHGGGLLVWYGMVRLADAV